MIDVQSRGKDTCCGCNGCVQVCPKECIHLKNDLEGFWYPVVDTEKCIRCGLCDKVCPELSVLEPSYPIKSFAAIHKDSKMLSKSSSGGVFAALAEYVLNKKGVVFGAVFNDNWEVEHGCIERIQDLYQIQGSKYVQSDIMDSYVQARNFLSQKKLVLFSGTPCQIAGLRSFLRKDYENLYLVDIICHGVPSPLVWKEYIENNFNKKNITNISFREKKPLWDKYSFMIRLGTRCFKEPAGENPYLRGFLKDIYLRPSCYNCSFKKGKSMSDCTIGDFWGIREIMPDLDVNRGCSCLMVNSDKGLRVIRDIDSLEYYKVNYEDILRNNPSLEESSLEHPFRSKFYRDFTTKKYKKVEKKWMRKPLKDRFKTKIKLLLIRTNLYKGV